MYGQTETQSNNPTNRFLNAPVEIPQKENVMSVNQETLAILYDAIGSLDGLANKFEGPSLKSATIGNASPEPIRSIVDDARRIRGMAAQILSRVQYLHEAIGKN